VTSIFSNMKSAVIVFHHRQRGFPKQKMSFFDLTLYWEYCLMTRIL